MKVLLLSDSHGHSARLVRVIEKEADCPLVFFLGDGLRDFEAAVQQFPERKLIAVRGNCDWDAGNTYDTFAYRYIEGNTIIATHGHCVGVKQSLQDLAAKAQDVRAGIALYGHTHRQAQTFVGGVLCINPGALCNGQYAVMTVTDKGADVEFQNNL